VPPYQQIKPVLVRRIFALVRTSPVSRDPVKAALVGIAGSATKAWRDEQP
jgi:hypothetical protein